MTGRESEVVPASAIKHHPGRELTEAELTPIMCLIGQAGVDRHLGRTSAAAKDCISFTISVAASLRQGAVELVVLEVATTALVTVRDTGDLIPCRPTMLSAGERSTDTVLVEVSVGQRPVTGHFPVAA